MASTVADPAMTSVRPASRTRYVGRPEGKEGGREGGKEGRREGEEGGRI